MILTVEQIAEEALALPSEARALLADRLVESLDPTEDGYINSFGPPRYGDAVMMSGPDVFRLSPVMKHWNVFGEHLPDEI